MGERVEKMTIYIGIDNGLSGGISVIDENQKVLQKHIMPTIKIKNKNVFDVQGIINIFRSLKTFTDDIKVMLEHAHVRPISGKRACFTTGFCYGLMQGILEGMNISYEIVNPKVWQKDIFQGTVSDTKDASILFCQRKWPDVDWTATERSNKAHDGLTDAVCIALYGYRQNR